MNLRFYIDPETGLPHIYRHEVSKVEVKEAMWKPGEDRSGRDDSLIAIGQTQTGRYLRVIYVPDAGTDGIFLITAYELIGKPLTAYRRRKRRK